MVNVLSTLSPVKSGIAWLLPKLLHTKVLVGLAGTTLIYVAIVSTTDAQPGKEFIPGSVDATGGLGDWIRSVVWRLPSIAVRTMRILRMKHQILMIKMTSNNGYNISHSSQLIEANVDRPGADLRRQFLSIEDTFRSFPMRAAAVHSHPNAAVNRTAMANHMQTLAFENGWIPYHVSRAEGDSYEGSRYFYTAKDLGIKYRNDNIKSNSVIIMTDVDYYANMNAWLELYLPILLYTFVPEQMSARRQDYAYHFEGDEVVFDVSGGAGYRHKLWVYTGDTISVFDTIGNLLTYSIEQRVVPDDPDHRFVIMVPKAKINYPYSKIVHIEETGLKRFKNRGYLYDPISDIMSVQVTAKYQSVELKNIVYEACKERMRNKISQPLIVDIERILRDAGVHEHLVKAPLIFKHMEHLVDKNATKTTIMPHEQNNSYHPDPPGALTHDDGNLTGEAATSNLISPGAAMPTNSEASDIATVQGRVIRPANNRIPPSTYNNEANCFLSQLVRSANVGTPWTTAQVAAEQDGIHQRARLEACKHTMSLTSPNSLKAFVKVEAYSTANDPRNITTNSAETTTMMSTFTYAFKESVLKQAPFYSPGMTPTQITDRMRDITTTSGVISSDFSRFDGSISEWLQIRIVRAAYLRWLKIEQRPEFDKWFNGVFIRRATTTHGLAYDPGWGTRSGSPITTDGNTLMNAFVTFCALRRTQKADGNVHSVIEAYNALGLYCGDDGYTSLIPGLAASITAVAIDFGLKVEVIEHRQGPYPYCGRWFIDPMHTPCSYQDPKRTLPKLHLVKNGSMSLEQRITNKATGYMVTDSKTPLIGPWCRKVLAITKLTPRNMEHEELYKMQHPWPQEDETLLKEAFAEHLELTVQELDAMNTLIEEAVSLTDFPILMEWNENAKIRAIRGTIIEIPHGDHNNSSPNVDPINEATPNSSNGRTQDANTRPTTSTSRVDLPRTINQHRRAGNGLQPLATTRERSRRQSGDRTNQPPPQVHQQTAEVRTPSTRTRRHRNTPSRGSPRERN